MYVCMYAYVRDVHTTGYTDLARPPLVFKVGLSMAYLF